MFGSQQYFFLVLAPKNFLPHRIVYISPCNFVLQTIIVAGVNKKKRPSTSLKVYFTINSLGVIRNSMAQKGFLLSFLVWSGSSRTVCISNCGMERVGNGNVDGFNSIINFIRKKAVYNNVFYFCFSLFLGWKFLFKLKWSFEKK